MIEIVLQNDYEPVPVDCSVKDKNQRGFTQRGVKPPSQFLSGLMRSPSEERAFRKRITKRHQGKRKAP